MQTNEGFNMEKKIRDINDSEQEFINLDIKYKFLSFYTTIFYKCYRK